MELSGRVFGFSSWSLLAPQALEGVAAVWLLYAAVRRWFGTAAGLLTGALLALCPVAALMFRFDNPDALLVLVLVGAGLAAASLPRPGARSRRAGPPSAARPSTTSARAGADRDPC